MSWETETLINTVQQLKDYAQNLANQCHEASDAFAELGMTDTAQELIEAAMSIRTAFKP